MARPQSASSNKIFILVFSIAFGLLALAFGYQAVMNSYDIRSRAAQAEKIYKRWEFNGQNTEGWSADAPHTGKVNSGVFLLTTAKGKQLPAMSNTSVSARLPNGIKSVALMMAVGKTNPPVKTPSTIPTTMGGSNVQEVKGETQESDAVIFNQTVKARLACTMDVKTCPDGSMVGRSGPTCQFLPCLSSERKSWSTTPTAKRFTGLLYTQSGNKKQYEKPVEFSGTANGMLQQYTINLPTIQATNIVKMRIVFTSGIQAGETISIDWIRLVGSVLKETPTPKPPVGCRYENVTCVKAPCNPILVCLTPTPVPSEKPVCSFQGTRSEGWYIGGTLIRYESCAKCQATCNRIGSRSEGWYDSCSDKLIQYASCGTVTQSPTPSIPTPFPTTVGCERVCTGGNCTMVCPAMTQ